MPETPESEPSARLHFVQWLRVLLISLVVCQHSAEPYVTTGGDWIVKDPASSDVLLSLFVLNGTFFMGFFFLISGYFLDASIDRHGAVNVIKARLVRFGIPLIVFVVFVNGAIGYGLHGAGSGFVEFVVVDYLGGGNAEFGPLWFIGHLLIYMAVYAALRGLTGRPWPLRPLGPPGHKAIFIFILGLGTVTALARLIYPIDDWVRLFWLVPAEPGRMPQYVSLFLIGVLAGRGAWFTAIDGRVAAIWFSIGLVVFAVMTVAAAPRLALPEHVGLRVTWGFLEAFVGVGMILGLLAVFRRFLALPGSWLSRLEGSVYGVYLVHIYFVIGLQMAVREMPWTGLAKFAVVAATSIALAFLLVWLLRHSRIVRKVV